MSTPKPDSGCRSERSPEPQRTGERYRSRLSRACAWFGGAIREFTTAVIQGPNRERRTQRTEKGHARWDQCPGTARVLLWSASISDRCAAFSSLE